MARLQRDGRRPVVDRVFDFEDVKAAFARLAEGPMGKVLVRVARLAEPNECPTPKSPRSVHRRSLPTYRLADRFRFKLDFQVVPVLPSGRRRREADYVS